MGTKQIRLDEVPGAQVIVSRLQAIDPGLTLQAAGYDFDRMMYILEIAGNGREGRVEFSRALLDDVRDNRTSPGSRYTQELHARLTDPIRQLVESNGLISFSETALKFKLLQFLHHHATENRPAEKYNTIGRQGQGDFERWLGFSLTADEKATLIWIWDELVRLRLIAPTGTDLVNPDRWVRVTDKGSAAIEGKSYVEYDEHEVFIPKGEVYTAYRTIKNIMSQAQTELLVIDPYVNEDLLDMLASLTPSVNVKVLTEHLKGDFRLALRKLQQQRGGIEVRCSSHFHDRFLILDRRACYHLGGSINHAGAKATVIGSKGEEIRDRVMAEAETAWQSAAIVT